MKISTKRQNDTEKTQKIVGEELEEVLLGEKRKGEEDIEEDKEAKSSTKNCKKKS